MVISGELEKRLSRNLEEQSVTHAWRMSELKNVQERLFRSIYYRYTYEVTDILLKHPELMDMRWVDEFKQEVSTPLIAASRAGIFILPLTIIFKFIALWESEFPHMMIINLNQKYQCFYLLLVTISMLLFSRFYVLCFIFLLILFSC